MHNASADYEEDAVGEIESLGNLMYDGDVQTDTQTKVLALGLSALTNAVLACAAQLERIANSAEDSRKL
jgi:hypothetical protein